MARIAALLIVIPTLLAAGPQGADAAGAAVRVIPIAYRAHDGLMRRAYVILPAAYVPGTPIPLVISPHGRGVGARTNVRRWARLPAVGDFAVSIPRDRAAR